MRKLVFLRDKDEPFPTTPIDILQSNLKCKVESASNMSSNMTFDDEENTCNDEFYSNDVENEEEEEVSEK